MFVVLNKKDDRTVGPMEREKQYGTTFNLTPCQEGDWPDWTGAEKTEEGLGNGCFLLVYGW